ncbi:MAG: isoprenylcysteine carboxylmethyltransferase family protein [Lysobacterales bacterium]
MPSLKLRVPPLLVFAIAALAIAASGKWLHLWSIPPWPRHLLATVLATSGVLVAVAGVLEFRRARTTVHPMHPDRVSALVTTGIFRYSRNPMYLGMLLVLAGLAAWVAQPIGIALLPLFVIYLNRYQISAEEEAIAAHFGQPYQEYCRSVRRWC